MPWNVTWRENQIIHVKLMGDMDIDATRAMNEAVVEQLNNATPPIFGIWDVAEMTSHPTKLRDLLDVAQPILNHPNLNAVVFLGLGSPVVKFVTTVVSTIGKLRFHVADDMANAQVIVDKLKDSYKVT